MNAIIGDNGIITRAKEANIQSSIASLEEYLQLKYTENYEEMLKYQSKIEGLTNEFSQYFYIPVNEGVGGDKYVIDKEGHALYLVKKSGLPEEIRESLVGGDAGSGGYADYSALNDVYGVTTDLKVYYCSEGADSIKGLAKESLDLDNPLREVFGSKSEMTESLVNAGYDSNGDGKITAEEAKVVKELTISKDDGISSLKELYNMTSLEELILDEVNLSNLDGIENVSCLYYIYLKNCTIGDYSKIGRLGQRLKYLYLYNTTDGEVSKLCDNVTGIASFGLPNLQYFAITGNVKYISIGLGNETLEWESSKSENTITTISPLSNLNIVTKKAIRYLSLQCNNIMDVTSLMDFSNVYLLRLESNKLKSLHGLENMKELSYLYANSNNLGSDEIDSNEDSDGNGEIDSKNLITDGISALYGKNKLYALCLRDNQNLIWIDYIENDYAIRHLDLSSCPKFNVGSVRRISKVYYGCTVARYRAIDEKFLSYLQSEEILDYKNLEPSDTVALNTLKNMTESDKAKVKKLDLSGSQLDNGKLNEIIKYFPNLICLNVNNCTNLETLDFTTVTTKLEQLLFLDTKVVGNEVEKLDNNTKSLQSIKCNNPDIDITKMQNVISRCGNYSGQYCFETLGCGLCSSKLIKKLEDCNSITYLRCNHFKNPEGDIFDLNLGNCDSLKVIADPCFINGITYDFGGGDFDSIRFWAHFNNCYAKASSSFKVKELNLGIMNYSVHFKNNFDKLKELNFCSFADIGRLILQTSANVNTITSLFPLLEDMNLKELEITSFDSSISPALNFEDWRGSLYDIKGLTIKSESISSLNFLKDNINLETLTLPGNKIIDISGISTLTNLKTIDLSNNSIRNLEALSNLKKLESLNLTGNLIEEFAVKEDGSKVDNLKILANLNPRNQAIAEENKGKLLKLYLAQNKIINDAEISGLKWDDWSGFGGK